MNVSSLSTSPSFVSFDQMSGGVLRNLEFHSNGVLPGSTFEGLATEETRNSGGGASLALSAPRAERSEFMNAFMSNFDF